jgi:uncharacterized protein YggE
MRAKLRLLLLPALLSPSYAADGQQEAPSIEVTGQATVESAPDQARVMLGVLTGSKTAKEAVSSNAAKARAIMSTLEREFAGKIEIETQSYSVSPRYESRTPGEGKGNIAGYEASTVLRATVRDFSILGDVLDAAVQAGTNQIYGLQFEVKNPQELALRAIRQAASDAKKEAEALASALGAAIGRIRSAKETSAPVRPLNRTFEIAAASEVPIVPGNVQTTAEVVLEIEVAFPER